MQEIIELSAARVAEKIKNGELSVGQVTEACLNRIHDTNDTWNSFLSVDREGAMARAEQVQGQIEQGICQGPLAGVPFAVKDNLCVKGMVTTCGSRMLEHFRPAYSATAVDRIIQQGGILLGKTNMDEFGMGSTGENSAFGPVQNPVLPGRVTGGSSSGSAAAVASGQCFYALGTDTGGSIRLPASHCGIYGIKPTYGSVSRYGLIAYASSFDQIGVLARNTTDLSFALEQIMGHDRRDATSVHRSYDGITTQLKEKTDTLRIAFPEGMLAYAGREVAEQIQKTAGEWRQLGAVVEEVRLEAADMAVPAYYTLAMAEASSNLERYDGVKYGYRCKEPQDLKELYARTRAEGFGAEVKRRIMMGCFVLSAGYYDTYYLKALEARRRIRQQLKEIYRQYDLILLPVARETAPLLGEQTADFMSMYEGDLYTVLANLAGLPAVSVPCHVARGTSPMGFQLMGRAFSEKLLLQAAYAYEHME